ncbi:hypothetical protein LTR78_010587 [Recurvomyces mirabilis]|uniref:Uncharacterized protein n=1 Tax=Recurvomyces mirabilis TaxID=574656 RepID=A0AAE0WI70_9PEZI|nr:hypothetical protein LTR78_010587 [Recurvomyces mirabilis]
MAPTRHPLVQTRFFERLSLDKDNELARSIYAMMKEEAINARERLTTDEAALVPALMNTGAKPPYSHAQISETALQGETQKIYDSARGETKVFYALGLDMDQTPPRNWVIAWMLWHVFRYRDIRNRNRKANVASNSDKDDNCDPCEASAPRPSAGLFCRYTDQLSPWAAYPGIQQLTYNR